MPIFVQGDTELYYEETGEGFPILLFAPGGMRSAISFWAQSPWNPIEALSDHFRVIAMDQRNAGRSKVPFRGTTVGEPTHAITLPSSTIWKSSDATYSEGASEDPIASASSNRTRSVSRQRFYNSPLALRTTAPLSMRCLTPGRRIYGADTPI